MVGPGPLSVVLGTSGVVFAALAGYRADPEARVHVFCHAVPDTWEAMGVMLSAAGSLRWLRDVVGGTYDELVAEAARWPAGTEGLTFLPYLQGERTPHADPDARACSRDCPCDTTAARSSARCSRASRTAFATRSSC